MRFSILAIATTIALLTVRVTATPHGSWGGSHFNALSRRDPPQCKNGSGNQCGGNTEDDEDCPRCYAREEDGSLLVIRL